ncbi:hypothetical protein V496_07095 [Pseudogymnoascus sp. VKM F-4515 (FW-2607)]|nr:hypothetical protein V496_07095 [Pseudogymnoascus sp. VKM F-4515 (FW-2607)]
MGNDGGSIPTRRELVKNAARDPNTSEAKATQLESQTHAWTYCPLSQRPLSTPIVSDCAGTLYNKDAIIEHLLPSDDSSPETKSDHEEVLKGRVKSLRDVVEVKFQTEKDEVAKLERRLCPITSKELGATTKSVYLVPCGHAFAEVATREVAGEACMQCNEPYVSENIITILPITKEDIGRLDERIKKLRDAGLTHSLKKAPGTKKRKKHTETETNESKLTDDAQSKIPTGIPDDVSSTVQLKNGPSASAGRIKNAATASLTAKVLDEQAERNKRRKLGLNDNLKSLFSNTGPDELKGARDFMTRGPSPIEWILVSTMARTSSGDIYSFLIDLIPLPFPSSQFPTSGTIITVSNFGLQGNQFSMSPINCTETPTELPQKYPHEAWSMPYTVPNSCNKPFEKRTSSTCDCSDYFDSHRHQNPFDSCQKPVPPLARPEENIKKAGAPVCQYYFRDSANKLPELSGILASWPRNGGGTGKSDGVTGAPGCSSSEAVASKLVAAAAIVSLARNSF